MVDIAFVDEHEVQKALELEAVRLYAIVELNILCLMIYFC